MNSLLPIFNMDVSETLKSVMGMFSTRSNEQSQIESNIDDSDINISESLYNN